MINKSTNPRTDLPYLRRRIKPGHAAAAPSVPQNATAQALVPASAGLSLGRPSAPQGQPSTPASPGGLVLGRPATTPHAAQPPAFSHAATAAPVRPASGGLDLGRNDPASSASAPSQKLAVLREAARAVDREVKLLFPAPRIRDVYELNLQERVLRLTALESAVGTMVVSGSTAMAWESVRRVSGGTDIDRHTAGSTVMTRGNRPLAGYDGRNALLALRHIRELRRAIFINRSNQAMGVQIFSGASVAVPPPADGTQIVLLALRIGNVLELRVEPVPHGWTDLQIWQEFDFTMTHKAPVAAYRR